jgi:tetratricopeptide (TPR) repeat protein
MARAILLVLMVILTMPAAGAAQADTDGEAAAQAAPADDAARDEQARMHFRVGSEYYAEGDFESALREFERAYEQSGRPGLLYNLYLSHQQLANLDEAISFLERYLAEVPEVEERATLEQRLVHLRARRERRQETGADPGEELAPEPAQTAAPASPAPPPRDATPIGPIVAFSVAGAGLVAAAILTGLTVAENDRLMALPCAASRSCSAAEAGSLDGLALGADVSWGVALAGAVTGVVLLLLAPGTDAEVRAALRRGELPSLGWSF